MVVQRIHTYCAMCVSRCGVVATVSEGVLTKVTPDPAHPNGGICVKGTAAPEIVYAPDRLRYPMTRTRPKGDPDPGWARISWDEALAMTASRLLDIKDRHGPEAVVFPVATPAGSAAIDFMPWAWRLANAFGSPNVVTNTHICQWHRDWGAAYTFGVGTPPPDYENARCILLWGFNPRATWPAMGVRIGQATARGAKLIVIDPRHTALAGKADLWLRVRPGADGALALAMIHVLLEERLCDEDFTRDWTNAPFLVREDTGQLLAGPDPGSFVVWDRHGGGPAAYRPGGGYGREQVEPALGGTYRVTRADGQTVSGRPVLDLLGELAARYAPERSEAITGVPAGQVRRAARLFARERPSCYFTWAGLEQRSDAAQTNRAISVLYALTGQFDQRGSNVLFAATPANPVTGHRLLPPGQAARRLGYAERPLGPAGVPGLVRAADVYRAILTGRPYPVRALVAFGTDPLLAHANPLLGRQALQAVDFSVHVDLFANPSGSLADLLLPAASCWESPAVLPCPPPYALAEHTGTWAQYRPAVVPPVHQARPDLEIIFDLAQRLGLGEEFFGGDIESAFDHQLAPSGLSVSQLRDQLAGVRVPGQTRYRKYADTDPATGQPRGFATPTGKLEIYSTSFARAGHPPLPAAWDPAAGPRSADTDQDYPLTLTFARLVQYCDDAHRNIPRLRRQAPEPFLEIHPATARTAGLGDGDRVLLETPAGAVTATAKLNASLHPTVVATQYGWWQECQQLAAPGYDPFGPEGANVNLLIPDDVTDPISGSVPHRSQQCRIRKHPDPAATAG